MIILNTSQFVPSTFSSLIISFFFLFISLPVTSQTPLTYDWKPLFNGNDISNWDIKISGYPLNENYGNTFRVSDGKLHVSYDAYDSFGVRFGHIFFKEKFSYYIVAAEYRFIGNQVKGGPGWAIRNSGIMVHGQSPTTMLRDQDFPISIEVQLLGGLDTGERSTANLCTPGTNVVMDGKLKTEHCFNSTSKTFHGDQWVRVEVLVLGDSLIRHMVNGETVFSYTKPQIGGGNVGPFDPAIKKDGQLLTEGTISLQSESHPIEFRKVEIVNLKGCMDPNAMNYKSYYVKADNSTCKYR